jgi:hypothetical protein
MESTAELEFEFKIQFNPIVTRINNICKFACFSGYFSHPKMLHMLHLEGDLLASDYV